MERRRLLVHPYLSQRVWGVLCILRGRLRDTCGFVSLGVKFIVDHYTSLILWMHSRSSPIYTPSLRSPHPLHHPDPHVHTSPYNLPASHRTGTSTTWSTPSNDGTSISYRRAVSSPRNRPPTKCRHPPPRCVTNGFGAVKLTTAVGIYPLPKPLFGGPASTSQLLGTSTASTPFSVRSSAAMTEGNGCLTSPLKLKPKMASTT